MLGEKGLLNESWENSALWAGKTRLNYKQVRKLFLQESGKKIFAKKEAAGKWDEFTCNFNLSRAYSHLYQLIESWNIPHDYTH